MDRRTTRALLLTLGATVAAMILIRAGGALFAWYRIPEPQSPQFARIAWIELGLEAVAIALGAAAAWRILGRGREEERKRARRDHLAEVGTLASGLAHEMRNYLNAVRTHVALLHKAAQADGGGCGTCQRRIQRLEATTRGLEELLNDFLTFARPLDDHLEEIGPGELVGEVVDFVRLDMEQAGVDLRLDIDGHVPPVCADRAKLKRAILNLLVNARQAMPDGGTVAVRVGAEAGSAVIEIADTGCGIAEEDRPRLFESFFSTKSDGAGLGLAIVKRTIEDLSGSVGFESVVGRGTTFRIVLPSSERSRKSQHREPGRTSEADQRADAEESGT